jgi:hypothetical protein
VDIAISRRPPQRLEQDHHGERRTLGHELPARERQARAAQDQFEQRQEQQRNHGAKHQAQHALLLMNIDRTHSQRAFDQGRAKRFSGTSRCLKCSSIWGASRAGAFVPRT